jgi:hypothetical protein
MTIVVVIIVVVVVALAEVVAVLEVRLHRGLVHGERLCVRRVARRDVAECDLALAVVACLVSAECLRAR